jgi:hypothetical protein
MYFFQSTSISAMNDLNARRSRFFLFAIAFTVTALGLAGCSSTVETAKVKGTEAVAVPVITVDEHIDLSDVQSGAGSEGIGTLVQRLLQDDSFDLSPMVEKLHANVYDTYAARLPGEVLSEEQVVGSERYQNFQLLDRESSDERLQRINSILVPDGYKKYNVAEGSVFGDRQKEMFGAVPDQADALLFVSANYAFEVDNPFWHMFLPFFPDQSVVEATVSMEMVNRSGDVILDVKRSAQSDERMTMVGGLNAEPDRIQALCFDATEKAFAKVDRFTKEELEGGS